MVKQMDCTLMWKVLLKKKVGNISKLLNNAPENAGDKWRPKKPKTCQINISKDSITAVQDQSESIIFDSEIALSKIKLFTEYCHNNVD